MDTDDRTLLMLGLLKAQAGHGYQLHDFIETNLARITELKKPTAYAALDRLVSEGLASVRTERTGRRPSRKVLKLTGEGRRRYRALLRQRLSMAGTAGLDGDVAMMFSHDLPRKELLECLDARAAACEERLRRLRELPDHGEGHGVALAIDHLSALVQSDLDWLRGTLARLRAQKASAPRCSARPSAARRASAGS